MSGPILLFGAGGQLGQEILAQASAQKIEILGVTRAQADITDSAAVACIVAMARARLIVNCAAYTAVDRAENEPAVAREVNVIGAMNIARSAANVCVPLVHISTDYVFDGTKCGAYVEDDATSPVNVYGQTKADGEAQVRALAPLHIILRTAWVYGQFGNNFLKTMLRLATERPELRVVGDQMGCPTSTQDLAAAIFLIDRKMSAGEKVFWGTYHFAGAGVTTWHGFAENIVAAQTRIQKVQTKIVRITTEEFQTLARRPANSVLDSSRFEAAFAYRAAPWQRRVAETVQMLLLPTEVQ